MWVSLPRLLSPDTERVEWRQWDFSVRHQGRLGGTGRCGAPAASSITCLQLLGAWGSSPDHCWEWAAIVEKDGTGQLEIKCL